jgi:hypothetical protein
MGSQASITGKFMLTLGTWRRSSTRAVRKCGGSTWAGSGCLCPGGWLRSLEQEFAAV